MFPPVSQYDIRPGTYLGNGSYCVLNILGQGACGGVYQVEDNKWETFALKVQQETKESEIIYNNELIFLNMINGTEGFPKLVDQFTEKIGSQSYCCLVTPIAGEALADVISRINYSICPENVVRAGYRIFGLAGKMHKLKYLHRDLHLGNILVNRSHAGLLYFTFIDFGMTTTFDSEANKIKIEHPSWTSSLNVLKGGEYSYYDDLISVVNSLFDLAGVNLFGFDTDRNSNFKKFHNNPFDYVRQTESEESSMSDYFTEEEEIMEQENQRAKIEKDRKLEFLKDLYVCVETARTEKWEQMELNSSILQILKQAIPGVDPKEPITYEYRDCKICIL